MASVFSPIKIGNLPLKNRIMMAPMETGLAEVGGFVGERLIKYFVERAENEVAIVITGSIGCRPEGRGLPFQLSCYDDQFIPGLARLAEAVHRAGAKIGGQIYHAGRQANRAISGFEPVAPSAIPCPVMNDPPRELSIEEIRELVEAFGSGARRLKEAGFDLIEVHLAHGYLLHSFLSPFSNKRNDLYGGSLANRMRFPIEVIRRIKAEVGESMAVTARISIEEFLPEGLTFAEAKEVCRAIVQEGIQAISISAGSYASVPYIIQPMSLPRGLLVPYAEELKKVVDVPVIVAGRINDPELVEQIIADGKADMVALGRALLADPEIVAKMKEGRYAEVRHCIACNQGCIDRLLAGQNISCLVNARTGFETERNITPAPESKKVLVVGGGPGGLEAARVAAVRGHKVMLAERTGSLGGKVETAAIPPGKKEFGLVKSYLLREVEKLGVEISLNVTDVQELIEKNNPDAVIIAVGAEPVTPDIPGIGSGRVIFAEEALLGKKDVGRQVAVIGGGMVGIETALFLAQSGRKVVVIEMLGEVARDVGPVVKPLLLQEVEKAGIEVLVNAEVKEITRDSVKVESAGKNLEVKVDTVVLAVGFRPLKLEIKSGGEILVIGDAKEVRKAYDAIHEGFLAGAAV